MVSHTERLCDQKGEINPSFPELLSTSTDSKLEGEQSTLGETGWAESGESWQYSTEGTIILSQGEETDSLSPPRQQG